MITDAGSLWELIERRVAATPDTTMLIDEDLRTMTYREYRDAAGRAAAGLAELGVGEGTPVSWALPTWHESLVFVGALARLGAVQNPILPIYRHREVGFVTKQTGAKLLIVPSTWKGFDYEGMAREIAAAQPRLDVLIVDRKLPDAEPALLAPPPAPPSSPTTLRCGGSSTRRGPPPTRRARSTPTARSWRRRHGMTKALAIDRDDVERARVPVHAHRRNRLALQLDDGRASRRRHRGVRPVDDDPGAATGRRHARRGGHAVPHGLPGRATPAPRRQAVPEACARTPAAARPSRSELHYDVKKELGGVGIVSGYGLTECPILAMSTVDDTDVQLADTEGRTTPGVEVSIVKLDESVAEPGEEGEIRVKGPMLFRGYVDSSLDRDAFDDGGWFRTGDLGFQDADGYVAITGRLKDVIIRKGETISAKEIEDLLFTHPGIGDVAVIGLQDDTSGSGRARSSSPPTRKRRRTSRTSSTSARRPGS